jgi:hypothetical protein
MTPKETLTSKAENMHKFLQSKYSSEPNDLIERIELLSILMSESGELLADAKYYRDKLVNGEIMNALKNGYANQLTPSALNKFVASLAFEENLLVNQFDRINASATHQLDGIRSVLSYRKTEFSTLNYQRG